MKITRIRAYVPRKFNPTFNQSDYVVVVETESGLTGVGEGGTRDTLTQCAGMLIGEDASRIQHCWQRMYRGFFYPAGREKLHALGALDLALWDIKGKALGVPVYELLGGLTRSHVECYSTAYPWQGDFATTARTCLDAGFRTYRTMIAEPAGTTFDARRMVEQTYGQCATIREGIGDDGQWAIDLHTRLDAADALRLCHLLHDLNPLFVEDPLRSENVSAFAAFRQQVRTPLAAGEQFGDRWDVHEMLERHLLDYVRMTLPNVGGITEFMKIAALCETHYVSMVPHFTGPIALAALVHVLAALPVPVMMEILGAAPALPPHLTSGCQFRDGKLWPCDRPGLGVEFDPAHAELIADITEPYTPIPMLQRPDGSFTNW